jgi:hypothetical protein
MKMLYHKASSLHSMISVTDHRKTLNPAPQISALPGMVLANINFCHAAPETIATILII